jgi:hypothetical protein
MWNRSHLCYDSQGKSVNKEGEEAMKEFMLLVLNQGGSKQAMSAEQHMAFVKKCELYIEQLKKDGKLISAQPLVKEGKVVSGSEGNWKEISLKPNKEIQLGYYHILADDIDEAVAIAKRNPEFQYTSKAKIEVRPIKAMEENTGFVYPKGL